MAPPNQPETISFSREITAGIHGVHEWTMPTFVWQLMRLAAVEAVAAYGDHLQWRKAIEQSDLCQAYSVGKQLRFQSVRTATAQHGDGDSWFLGQMIGFVGCKLC